ncbi:MAG: hypothetical protein IJT01_04980 [Selenomonadaceae bacterium]|nr:hypothetical protein [Selenomonadaceae bacterium]
MLDMEQAKDLEAKLGTLTGYDFEIVEREERLAGNGLADAAQAKSFQTRLAARALNVPMQELQELPIVKYNTIATRVYNFLFSSLVAELLSQKLEAAPSTSKQEDGETSNSG